jgi:hypothetical protein
MLWFAAHAKLLRGGLVVKAVRSALSNPAPWMWVAVEAPAMLLLGPERRLLRNSNKSSSKLFVRLVAMAASLKEQIRI